MYYGAQYIWNSLLVGLLWYRRNFLIMFTSGRYHYCLYRDSKTPPSRIFPNSHVLRSYSKSAVDLIDKDDGIFFIRSFDIMLKKQTDTLSDHDVGNYCYYLYFNILNTDNKFLVSYIYDITRIDMTMYDWADLLSNEMINMIEKR